MKRIWLYATLLAFWAAPGFGQTTQELVNDGKNPENVLTHSMGYDRKSFSPLNQINKSNVKRLVPIWNASVQPAATPLPALDVVLTACFEAISAPTRWVAASSYDAAPPHGPPRPVASLRGPPLPPV